MASNPLRLRSVAKILVDVHVELHQATAPEDLQTSHELFGSLIEKSDLVPAPVRERALSALTDLPHDDVICHGDFHPGNVLVGDSMPLTLIDWTGATRGDPTGDFARTRLMLQVGELPPGAPVVVRALAAVGRRVLWQLYDLGYRRARPVDPERLRGWTLVAAANRLTESVESERESLLRIVQGEGA